MHRRGHKKAVSPRQFRLQPANHGTTMRTAEQKSEATARNTGREGLYGLTTSLVRAVASALQAGETERLRTLIKPLHEADIADLIERIPPDGRTKLIEAAGDLFTGGVLVKIGRAHV